MNRLKNKFHKYFGESFNDFIVYRQGFAFLAVVLALVYATIQIIRLT